MPCGKESIPIPSHMEIVILAKSEEFDYGEGDGKTEKIRKPSPKFFPLIIWGMDGFEFNY
jgi:hypothetical protein